MTVVLILAGAGATGCLAGQADTDEEQASHQEPQWWLGVWEPWTFNGANELPTKPIRRLEVASCALRIEMQTGEILAAPYQVEPAIGAARMVTVGGTIWSRDGAPRPATTTTLDIRWGLWGSLGVEAVSGELSTSWPGSARVTPIVLWRTNQIPWGCNRGNVGNVEPPAPASAGCACGIGADGTCLMCS